MLTIPGIAPAGNPRARVPLRVLIAWPRAVTPSFQESSSPWWQARRPGSARFSHSPSSASAGMPPLATRPEKVTRHDSCVRGPVRAIRAERTRRSLLVRPRPGGDSLGKAERYSRWTFSRRVRPRATSSQPVSTDSLQTSRADSSHRRSASRPGADRPLSISWSYVQARRHRWSARPPWVAWLVAGAKRSAPEGALCCEGR